MYTTDKHRMTNQINNIIVVILVIMIVISNNNNKIISNSPNNINVTIIPTYFIGATDQGAFD